MKADAGRILPKCSVECEANWMSGTEKEEGKKETTCHQPQQRGRERYGCTLPMNSIAPPHHQASVLVILLDCYYIVMSGL